MDSVFLSPFAVPSAAPMPTPSGIGAASSFVAMMTAGADVGPLAPGMAPAAMTLPQPGTPAVTMPAMLASTAGLDSAMLVALAPGDMTTVAAPGTNVATAITVEATGDVRTAPDSAAPLVPTADMPTISPANDAPATIATPALLPPAQGQGDTPNGNDPEGDASTSAPPSTEVVIRSTPEMRGRSAPTPTTALPASAPLSPPQLSTPAADTTDDADASGNAAVLAEAKSTTVDDSAMRAAPDAADPQPPVAPVPPLPTPAVVPPAANPSGAIVQAAPAVWMDTIAPDADGETTGPVSGKPSPRASRRGEPSDTSDRRQAAVPFMPSTPAPSLTTTPPQVVQAISPGVADEPSPDRMPAARDAVATTASSTRTPDPIVSATPAADRPAAQAPTATPTIPTALATSAPTTATSAQQITPPAAPEPTVVAAQPGRIGQETGVAIARHAVQGVDTVAIRLDPVDMGRIEVRLSFEEGGTLRAVVAADNPASLDLLRRDSPQLIRALTDAGIATDAGSFRFDTRSDDRGGGGNAWQRPQPASPYARDDGAETPTETPEPYRRMTTRGRVDVMA